MSIRDRSFVGRFKGQGATEVALHSAFRASGREPPTPILGRRVEQGHPKYPRFIRRRWRVLGRLSLLGELILRRSVLELPKGAGDGMTTHQVLSEGGDGPR